jgi:hypothetical protein
MRPWSNSGAEYRCKGRPRSHDESGVSASQFVNAQMFDRLIHADWSKHDKNKWMTIAERMPLGWQVAAPQPVPRTPELSCRP